MHFEAVVGVTSLALSAALTWHRSVVVPAMKGQLTGAVVEWFDSSSALLCLATTTRAEHALMAPSRLMPHNRIHDFPRS